MHCPKLSLTCSTIFILTVIFSCIPISKQSASYTSLEPQLRHYMPINYPVEAKRKRIEGTVIAELHVTSLGYVYASSIIQPVHPLLDKAVHLATLEWIYRPESINHKNITITISHTFCLPRRPIRSSPPISGPKPIPPIEINDDNNPKPVVENNNGNKKRDSVIIRRPREAVKQENENSTLIRNKRKQNPLASKSPLKRKAR